MSIGFNIKEITGKLSIQDNGQSKVVAMGMESQKEKPVILKREKILELINWFEVRDNKKPRITLQNLFFATDMVDVSHSLM